MNRSRSSKRSEGFEKRIKENRILRDFYRHNRSIVILSLVGWALPADPSVHLASIHGGRCPPYFFEAFWPMDVSGSEMDDDRGTGERDTGNLGIVQFDRGVHGCSVAYSGQSKVNDLKVRFKKSLTRAVRRLRKIDSSERRSWSRSKQDHRSRRPWLLGRR